LRTDDSAAAAAAAAAAVREPQPQQTDASNDNRPSLPPAPVCGGYIVVGPDTFGCIDDAGGLFAGTDSGVESGRLLRRPRDDGYADLVLASDLNPQHSDLVVTEDSHQHPLKESAAVNDRTEVIDVDTAPPSVERGVQGNVIASDSAPVTNYAMIMGVNNNNLDDTECCSLDNASVGQSDNFAEHPVSELRTAEESRQPSRSVSEDEQRDDVAVPFGISSPPASYSLNSGGYLSHSELLGATPAV